MWHTLTHNAVLAAVVIGIPAIVVATIAVVGTAAVVLHFQTRPTGGRSQP